MDKLRGVVEHITYVNEDTGYGVIKLRCKGYGELVTFVGNIASVNVGAVLTASGKWTHDAKYGKQFSVDSWEESVPASIYGIEKYLGSGLIKGIGPKFAKLIVNLERPKIVMTLGHLILNNELMKENEDKGYNERG